MPALSPMRAQPTDPLRGVFLDGFAFMGIPPPEDAIGTFADVLHVLRMPTAKDAVPMPLDALAKVGEAARSGRALPMPPTPPTPPQLPGMPSLASWLPRPGEGDAEATRGSQVVRSETGSEYKPEAKGTPVSQGYYYQPRYYQRS